MRSSAFLKLRWEWLIKLEWLNQTPGAFAFGLFVPGPPAPANYFTGFGAFCGPLAN
jgi:hypothetical protein